MTLQEWTAVVCRDLGIEGLDQAHAQQVVLDLARDVAHGVARPAAPVTAFLLGLAAGGQPAHSLDELAATIRALIEQNLSSEDTKP